MSSEKICNNNTREGGNPFNTGQQLSGLYRILGLLTNKRLETRLACRERATKTPSQGAGAKYQGGREAREVESSALHCSLQKSSLHQTESRTASD